MREIKYPCGCVLKDEGVAICMTHFVIFEDELMKEKRQGMFRRKTFIHKYTNGKGWLDIPQELYDKIIHCISVEAETWIRDEEDGKTLA